MATVARVAMSRGIVCGCGVGSYCEGRVDVNNAVGVLFWKRNGCLVSAVAWAIGSGGVVIGAVIVGNAVSRVIITGTVMLGGCHVGGCCVEIHNVGSCGVGGCRVCVCNEEDIVSGAVVSRTVVVVTLY